MVTLHALGAVGAARAGVDLPLGGARQRRLLAVLLVHRDSVVSVDRIADAVFAGIPTDAAGTTLRSYVARLRRVLCADDSSVRIETRSPGYRLRVASEDFDVTAFEAAVSAARAALRRGDQVAAAARATEGLALWHGTPYAEFADEDWVYGEVQRLAELRLVAHELLVQAQIAAGDADAAVPLAESLAAQHPLRESFRAQLMTAYYATGRQADALEVLRTFRTELADELGIDPSPRLVELEERILNQDPVLLVPSQGAETLRGYLLGERLGTGREGVVRAARLPGTGPDLVVKTLRPEVADHPDFIRRFEPLAAGVSSVRHPGVLPLRDYWREPGAAHIVWPRMPGGTLRDRLRRRAVTPTDVVALGERVGGALAHAHDAGVLHGAVTPENVLYDDQGLPVLTDFWLGQPSRDVSAERDRADYGALVRECLDALASVPAGLERLVALDGAEVDAPQRNPYRGLQAFTEADALFYFGREALVGELVSRLGERDPAGRLVLLVGASGTGKSSVVRAGLVPALRAGAVVGSERWFVVTMMATGTPFQSLAEGLGRVLPLHSTERTTYDGEGPIATGDGAVRDLASSLRAHPAALADILRDSLPEGSELVLVVDQFEELFTLADDEERRTFLDCLTTGVLGPESRLRIVATLRADYYDRPLAVQPFGGLVSDATVAIPAMLPAELEAAIVEPARRLTWPWSGPWSPSWWRGCHRSPVRCPPCSSCSRSWPSRPTADCYGCPTTRRWVVSTGRSRHGRNSCMQP